MKTVTALIATLVLAGAASAQSTAYGDPNFNRASDWRSGMPNVLKVVAGNVNYQFGGTAAEIPFTLDGGPAEVYLAVYSRDANPQYGGAAVGVGGKGGSMIRRAGMDTLIAVTSGQTFPEGANVIAWDGRDFNGGRVAPGNYTFYLFAVDNISNPTVVGPGAHTGYWSAFAIDASQSPPVVWAPQFVNNGWYVQRATMGTDYLANPGAWQTLDVNWVNTRFGAPVEFRDITFFLIDPDNPNVGYMGKTAWNDNALPQGLWKVIYDPANSTLLPDESWPGASNGFISMDRRVVGGALTAAVNHPWVGDDGRVYVANMDRVPPMTPQVLVIDRTSGNIVDVIDLTDIYFHDYDGTGQNVDTSGPYGIDVDERGVYTTGFWIQPDAYPGHFTLDGDVIWLNKDGDGILDRYFGEEATARGLDPNKDQMVNTHVKTGKYNIAFLSGFNLPTWGSVVGPDGHGLFSISLPKMPVGLGTDMMWISNDSPIDGIYVGASNGMDLVHWPFDVARAVIGTNVSTAVTEVEGAAVPSDYALGNCYPNPFNPSTTIEFAIPQRAGEAAVTLAVFNAAGQRVNTLVAGRLQPGQYAATWDGMDASGQHVSSGVYLYRLHVGQEFVETRQMTLVR
ncbi:MAG: FlgD immunoglobulin-like domain containing protein [Candidatus Latescibacterota bacterium]